MMTHLPQGSAVTPAPPAQPDANALAAQIEQAVNDAVASALQGRSSSPEAAVARDRARAAIDRLRADLAARNQGGPVIVQPQFGPDVIPPQAVDISVAFFTMVVFIVVGLPLARAFARRMDRRGQAAPASELAPRLDRIEQAVEAIAIEVERVSENQRYSTKVLSELRGLPSPNPMNGWPAQAREKEPASRDAESRHP